MEEFPGGNRVMRRVTMKTSTAALGLVASYWAVGLLNPYIPSLVGILLAFMPTALLFPSPLLQPLAVISVLALVLPDPWNMRVL